MFAALALASTAVLYQSRLAGFLTSAALFGALGFVGEELSWDQLGVNTGLTLMTWKLRQTPRPALPDCYLSAITAGAIQ